MHLNREARIRATLSLLSLSSGAFGAPQFSKRYNELVARAPAQRFVAVGDSYASGIAAGEYVNPTLYSADWVCSRFTNAYGRLLNGMLDGGSSREFRHLACSGKTCEEVAKDQKPANNADLITLTAGGNNVKFSDIVDNCVYRFKFVGSCENSLKATQDKIDNELFNSLWNTIHSILTAVGSSNTNFKLMVTNYPKFWNADTDQCDSVSWDYWRGPGHSDKMTKEKRKTMNDLSDRMNAVIKRVVQSWNNPESDNHDPRVHLVDIDSAFEGHRFCENEYPEPWTKADQGPRDNQWIFQMYTPEGSLRDAKVSPLGDGLVYAQSMQDAQKADSSLQPPADYAPFLIKPDDEFSSGGLPLWISKIFHPTSPGHQGIADAVKSVIDKLETAPNPRPSGGQQLNGPTTFCMGLSPGGGDICMVIPQDCSITVPVDNTIPKLQCSFGGAAKVKRQTASLLASSTPSPLLSAVARSSRQQFGPSKFCFGISPGGGDTCIDIPAGCFIDVPVDNLIPPIQCDETGAVTSRRIEKRQDTALPPTSTLVSSPVPITSSAPVSATPVSTPPATVSAPEQKFGPAEHCVALGRGGGPPTCIDIPTGCFIDVPLDNTVPTVQCDEGGTAASNIEKRQDTALPPTSTLVSTPASITSSTPVSIPAATISSPEQKFGPAEHCVFLGRGGGPPACISIPAGCFINLSFDNTIPEVQCPTEGIPAKREALKTIIGRQEATETITVIQPTQTGTRNRQIGPSEFCISLSRGGGAPTCIDIPAGCFIDIPVDNTVPTPICITASVTDIQPNTIIKRQATETVTVAQPTQTGTRNRQIGPSQFCQGLSPGGGESCISIPAGCFIDIPLDNTVPTPICNGFSLAESSAKTIKRSTTSSKFCMALSPGGSPTCMDIPVGCSVTVPLDNTFPTPVCDGMSAVVKRATNVKAKRQVPGDDLFGPAQFCPNTGSGESCITIPPGCSITVPLSTSLTAPIPECESAHMNVFKRSILDAPTHAHTEHRQAKPRPGDRQSGPSRYCVGLSEECIGVPAGCYIIVPGDDTVPEIECRWESETVVQKGYYAELRDRLGAR